MKALGRDPHLNAIRKALAGHLDKEVFERCLGDLLRPELPGLVPVTGGKDGGWDGAFLDDDLRQCPLIVTAARDYRRNLTKSLETLRSKPHPPEAVAFATSQHLTPPGRSGLISLAREKGFKLLQIFDQEAIADRLYHSSRWARELLGLSGAPSVLGRVPRGRRSQAGLELLGRDEDREWLRNLSPGSDHLLIGEPGSGKTYLLAREIAAERFDGLFLLRWDVSEDELANALRDQRPPFLIVDDAHVDLTALDRLRGIRNEQQSGFGILATTWPGREPDVREAMGGLPRTAKRKLELLPRRDILAILRAMGVEATVPRRFLEPVLRELADQAANRPGLAVTLGQLWKSGSPEDRESLWRGEALRDHLMTSLKELVGEDVTALLACLALGGEAGCQLSEVAKFLDLPMFRADRLLTDLAAAGVVATAGSSCLKVLPRSLRAPLVAQKFFSPGLSQLDPGVLIGRLPEVSKGLEMLAQAAVFGAPVPSDLMRKVVVSCTGPEAWRALASASSEESQWVLDNYLGPLSDIAEVTLQRLPAPTLERLLRQAESDKDLSPLLKWLREEEGGPPETAEILRRRRVAIEGVLQFLSSGGEPRIAWRVFSAALDRSLRGSDLSAGRDGLRSWHGYLPATAATDLTDFWAKMAAHLPSFPPESWPPFKGALEQFIAPHSLEPPSEAHEETWQNLATTILSDFSELDLPLELRIGVSQLGQRIGRDRDPRVPEMFEVLFPDFWEGLEEDGVLEQKIAREWLARAPGPVVTELRELESAARFLGRNSSARLLRMLNLAADACVEPGGWLAAMAEDPVPWNWSVSFIQRLLELRLSGWKESLQILLEISWMAPAAIFVSLQSANVPSKISERAFSLARENYPEMAVSLVERGLLPTDQTRRLLELGKPLSARIAIALWSASPQSVPLELRSVWETALLSQEAEDLYSLEEILRADAVLAGQWLSQRLDGAQELFVSSLTEAATAPLSDEDRRRLIERFSDSTPPRLVPLIVGRDIPRFELLLSRPISSRLKAAALQGRPHLHSDPVLDESWKEMVKRASSAGLTAAENLRGTFSSTHFYSGFGVEYWSSWEAVFSAVADDPESAVREVAVLGMREAKQAVDEARPQEQQAELEGLI